MSNKRPENAEYKLSKTPLWEMTPNQNVKDNSSERKQLSQQRKRLIKKHIFMFFFPQV